MTVVYDKRQPDISSINQVKFFNIMKRPLLKLAPLALLFGLILFMGASAHAALPSAESSINRMVAAMKKNPSLDIVFTVWNNGNSYSGSMKVAGRRFHLSTPEMKVWYDGKTQWAYSPSAMEVNVTEPTDAELSQANPLSILSNLNRNFTFRRLKATPGEERIELVPKKKSADFSSAVIVVNARTSLPKEIDVKDSKGRVTAVKISGITGGKTLPAGAFRFDPSKYPDVEVVDLR